MTKTTTTQAQQVESELARQGQAHARQLAEELDIIDHNVRRILGQGAKDGKFVRVARGVYALRNASGSFVYVRSTDAVAALPELAKRGMKADLVFLDVPYKTPAIVGGNRGVKVYSFITPEQFDVVVQAAKKVLRDEDAPIYYMFSQAPSGKRHMQQYTDAFAKHGFKLVALGAWRKTFADGSPVTNPRGEPASAEGLALFNLSGKSPTETLPSLDFTSVRPPVAGKGGRQSQKPVELYAMLLDLHASDLPPGQRPTFVTLDPFAGTGGMAAASQSAGVSNVSLEMDEAAIEAFILPRTEAALQPA